jgi:Zn-dependent protease
MDNFLIILIFLFSVIIHEIFHGEVANLLGDQTAKDAGRLTLNPIKHLDPFGSIILPGFLFLMSLGLPPEKRFIFGWAKPVPVNPYNFRDQKYGEAKVAMAGPGANLLIALIFGFSIRFLPLENPFSQKLGIIFAQITWVNLLLAFLNLIPIFPLDGSHILFAFLPPRFESLKIFLQRYGFIILVLVIIYFFQWFFPLIDLVFRLIVGYSPG